jgi:hypothetical protein
MRPCSFWPVSAVAGLACLPGRRSGHRTLCALAAGVVAAGGPAAAAAPAAPPSVSVTPAGGTASAVTVPLLTGGHVTVTATAGGRSFFLLRAAAGDGGAVEWYQTPAGERYVIPAVALPYVGKELGRSLFDVSARGYRSG